MLALLSLIGEVIAFSPSIPRNCTLPSKYREDCGYFGITKEECASRDCCWVPCTEGRGPWCFPPKDIRSARWECRYAGDDLEYDDGLVKLRAKWREYGVDVARLTLKDSGDKKENLLWEHFYQKRPEKVGTSVINVVHSKEKPSFTMKADEAFLFELQDLIWMHHFISFTLLSSPNSTVPSC